MPFFELIDPEAVPRRLFAAILDRSPGHYQEWIDACKSCKPAGSKFVDRASRLAEVALTGIGPQGLRKECRLASSSPTTRKGGCSPR